MFIELMVILMTDVPLLGLSAATYSFWHGNPENDPRRCLLKSVKFNYLTFSKVKVSNTVLIVKFLLLLISSSRILSVFTLFS